jgi:hypothetical protein
VDILRSQIASLGCDKGMPLGEEGDSYTSSQSRRSSNEKGGIHTPHEITAPGREDEGGTPDTVVAMLAF